MEIFILYLIGCIILVFPVMIIYEIIYNIIYTSEIINGIAWSTRRVYNRWTGKTKGIYSLWTDDLLETGESYDLRIKRGF